MKARLPGRLFPTGLFAGFFFLCCFGCHTYTGVEKTEFVKEERVDEVTILDEITISPETEPLPGNAFLEFKVVWDFKQEYQLRKSYRVFREVYPFDPVWEVLEVLSAPFLFLTVLPTSILIAPVELLTTGQKEKPDYVFVKMFRLPFAFLNPGGNADQWVDRRNVYGKEPELEMAGFWMDKRGSKQTEETHEDGSGAEIKIHIPEIGKTFSLKADEEGRARLPIGTELAGVSQEGKGLTLKVDAVFRGREASREFRVSPDILEEIYEDLMLE